MRKNLQFIALFVLSVMPCLGQTNCAGSSDFGQWLTCKIDERKTAAAGKVALKANATNGTKQEEAPSAASQTTSLVDQSSASDLFNLALHLAKLNTGDVNNDTNSVTVTTSAYALYAAANYHDPLDPAFYATHRQWRRVYFTLGRDIPDSSATQPAQDPHKTQTGTIAGIKLLLLDHRDITSPANKTAFDNVKNAMTRAAADRAGIQTAILTVVNGADQRFANLTSAEEQTVNNIIDARITSFASLDDVTANAVDSIKKNQQWSINYTAEIRNSQGFNEHKVTMVLDWGLHSRLNLTANAGLDIQDGKSFAPDSNGATAAAELQFRVTEDPKLTQPVLLSFAGNGTWLTNTSPVYKGQLKLTLPLGQKSGVSMPLSVTYASRADLIQESHVEGRFGFTFDAQKIAAALLGSK
ncbi:MAG TPA: hypothetical protein VGK21_03625 [Candidatus Angelobacter sp.]